MEEYIYYVAIILAAILGLCVGSFLNVVIYRCPNNMNLAKPASHCPKCEHKIRWYDNIPVISYIILHGKCRDCKEPISIRYTLVELANAILWVLCVLVFWKASIVYSIVMMLICSVSICIFFVDLEHQIILDRFQLILLGLAIISIFFDTDTLYGWQSKLLGMVFCGGVFLIFHYGAMFILKKEGLGGGDVKLAAICGLLLGFERGILAILLASLSASIVLLIVRGIRKDKKGHEYPFAPFIVASVILCLFVGSEILFWYKGLFF